MSFKLTLCMEFQHYYKNLGIMSHFLYFLPNKNEEERENKIIQAIYFGMLHGKIQKMEQPIVFVNLHRYLPVYSELPKKQQKYVRELDEILRKAKDFIIGPCVGRYEPDNEPYRKYKNMLENNDKEGIEIFLNTLEGLLNDFYIKLEGLSKFTEIYREV